MNYPARVVSWTGFFVALSGWALFWDPDWRTLTVGLEFPHRPLLGFVLLATGLVTFAGVRVVVD